jgi:hypothetical protein
MAQQEGLPMKVKGGALIALVLLGLQLLFGFSIWTLNILASQGVFSVGEWWSWVNIGGDCCALTSTLGLMVFLASIMGRSERLDS